MKIAWSGLTRVFHTGWTENGQPCAAWKIDHGDGTDPLYSSDLVGINVNMAFRSDFDAIPKPRAWVEFEDATVWVTWDGAVMIRP